MIATGFLLLIRDILTKVASGLFATNRTLQTNNTERITILLSLNVCTKRREVMFPHYQRRCGY